MTPRVISGHTTGENKIIQEDICPEEVLAERVPQKSARHFLLCVAKSPLERGTPMSDSATVAETAVH